MTFGTTILQGVMLKGACVHHSRNMKLGSPILYQSSRMCLQSCFIAHCRKFGERHKLQPCSFVQFANKRPEVSSGGFFLNIVWKTLFKLELGRQIYAETRNALVSVEDQKNTQEILVLRGGFAALQARYKACYQTVS